MGVKLQLMCLGAEISIAQTLKLLMDFGTVSGIKNITPLVKFLI